MSKKVVLEEDEYVEALERIIERDFFPDLPTLRKQNERFQSISAASGLRPTARTEATTALQAEKSSVQHEGSFLRSASLARSEISSWDQPTPTRLASSANDNGHNEGTRDAAQHTETTQNAASDLTLNRFVATHTSEDNAGFTELQEKAIDDHKRKYHWAYDSDGSKGDPKLHLLANGEWISTEQRRIVDQVLAPQGPADDRPSAPETWPFRARNALLFPPELAASREICQVTHQDRSTRLIENGADSTGVNSQALSLRTGKPPRGKRETVYANSRFKSRASTHETTTTQVAGPADGNPQAMDLVQMTPLIAPGVDASPLMTWGDIEGTPMVLDAARATPDRILSGPSFHVKENSTREKVASRLETEARIRKAQSQQRTPTPQIARGKRSSSELPTPSRSTSIRSRLSSVRSAQRTPLFGSDSELRASYATPLLPPRHSKSSQRKM